MSGWSFRENILVKSAAARRIRVSWMLSHLVNAFTSLFVTLHVTAWRLLLLRRCLFRNKNLVSNKRAPLILQYCRARFHAKLIGKNGKELNINWKNNIHICIIRDTNLDFHLYHKGKISSPYKYYFSWWELGILRLILSQFPAGIRICWSRGYNDRHNVYTFTP